MIFKHISISDPEWYSRGDVALHFRIGHNMVDCTFCFYLPTEKNESFEYGLYLWQAKRIHLFGLIFSTQVEIFLSYVSKNGLTVEIAAGFKHRLG